MVSLNPIMVDGTGMCGGCRGLVDGKSQFACVDGPEFDAHRGGFRHADEAQRHVPRRESLERLSQDPRARSAAGPQPLSANRSIPKPRRPHSQEQRIHQCRP